MSPKAFDYTGVYTIILTETYRDQYNIITKGNVCMPTVWDGMNDIL